AFWCYRASNPICDRGAPTICSRAVRENAHFVRKKFLMMRRVSLLACVLVLVVGIGAGARAQTGFDRQGGDYMRFAVPSGDREICATRCDQETRCRAWTFSYPPETTNAVAICWLKNKVTPRIADNCCVTGVKGGSVAEPHSNEFEFAIDRSGG